LDSDTDFAAYVAARGQRLVRSAVLLGCSVPDAEDLAQTVLLRCYSSWGRVVAADDVDAYVYRVLVNCLSTGRRRKWTGEVPTADLPESAGVDGSDRLAVGASVRVVLGAMSVERRTVLVLRYFVDLTDLQIAEVLAVPVGTVKSRLARALDQLSQDGRLVGLSGKECTS
jgi:RNA polymerase sigma-70 factor (sigma-E family)